MDFERVLDDMNIYAFLNWEFGELAQGPEISKYRIKCTFCWPLTKMPDPSGAQRLLQYGVKVDYRKAWLVYPIKIESEADYRPRVKKPKMARTRVWLVSINIPSHLIKEVTKGSTEIMDQEIDLQDIDAAYDEGLDGAGALLGNEEEGGNPEQAGPQ